MGKQNDVKNDIVFTPKYFADFMCDLAEIDETSVVLDNACGAGALLSSAAEKGARGVGIEFDKYVFQELTDNMKNADVKIYCGDGLKLNEEQKNGVNRVVINPPYSFPGKGLIFADEASKGIKEGKMIVLIPSSGGLDEKWTAEVLKNNTLRASIECPDIFKGFASVSTALYLFDMGRPHQADDEVIFIDFKNDGYKRTARKGQKGKITDSGNAEALYKEVTEIIKNGKEPELLKDKVIKETLEEKKEWNFTNHRVIDTVPTIDDFKKTVSQYLDWKCKVYLEQNLGTDYMYLRCVANMGIDPRKISNGKIVGNDEKEIG